MSRKPASPAFHPKARDKKSDWQVFWLVSVYRLPIPVEPGQWLKDKRLGMARETYSYGDSAGLAPDFPFNPFVGTRSAAKVMERGDFWREIWEWGLIAEI